MRYRIVRRRLRNFLQTLLNRRRTHTTPSATPLIVNTIRRSQSNSDTPRQSNSSTPHHTNDLQTPRSPSAGSYHYPLVTSVDDGSLRLLFLHLEGAAPSNHDTRGTIDVNERAPQNLEDLSQAPIVNGEIRVAGVMVEAEEFWPTIWRIGAIWDEFDAADAGISLLLTTTFMPCC